jgi:hypothetical protein
MSRNRIEIGSEFWFESNPQPTADRDGIYALSGRTAIDLIIQNILATRKVQNVYMPAWGCDSMIAPFVDRGIRVGFYDMRFNGQLEYLVEENKQADIFYVNNYFGYENTIDVEIIKHFRAKGSIIIYDRTHSMLMDDEPIKVLADYSFASIRKWMGVIDGAVVEGLNKKDLKPCPYLAPKEEAMRMKQAFMAGDDTADKQAFLKLYGEFGHHLADDYRNYAMDDLSYAIYKATDIETMKAQRKANAQYLHEHLNLQFLSQLTPNACPLFVPVLFSSKEERDRIRKRLIEAEIYCPIHWPKNQLITSEMEVNQIFDTELSLICDQRYGIPEMQRIIETIQE